MYSIFAKAHEYKCGFTSENGTKCNGKPKLGELAQVCINIKHNEDRFQFCRKNPFPMSAEFFLIYLIYQIIIFR